MSDKAQPAPRRMPSAAGRRRDGAPFRGTEESRLKPDPRRLAAAKGEVPAFDIHEVIAVVRRRFPVILGSAVLVMVVAMVYISQLVPRYSAESWVMLDTRHVHLGLSDMMSGYEVDGAVVRSEIDILRSYPLAQKVATQLHLEREPEYNPSLRHPSAADRFKQHPVSFLKSELDRLIFGPPPPAPPVKIEDSGMNSGIVWDLMGHVSVSSDGRSYLLRIHATSQSPALAAKIANAYADAYLLDQLDLKYAALRRTNNWLNEHLGDLREKVRQSDDAVQAFKQQHDMTQTVTGQQLSAVNSELVTVSAERAQKEASLRELQQQAKSGAALPSAIVESPMMEKLREQQTELLQRQAELAARYEPEHPIMVKLHAQIQDVARKIGEETGKTIGRLASDLAVVRAREAALRQTLAGLQQSTQRQDKAAIDLRELERQAAANKMLYENFLAKFKETSAQQDIQQPDARLVAPAVPPTGASYPDRPRLMHMAALLAIASGFGLAYLLEYLDNGFRTAEQVEQALDIRALGLVPGTGRGEVPQKLVVEQPKSLYAEAVRSVRTALRYTSVDRPPKLVVVTSSLPNEGKTVMALSLARSVARSGGKALIVDCDLRRPGIAKLSGCSTARNILDLFDGAEPETLISRDPESGVDVITAKAGTANPQDVLGSERMQAFLEAMRGRYDLIVLDTPPVLVVSDPIVLSQFADATLFLIRWERSSRKSVTKGLRLLRADGVNLAGAVVTRVNTRRHARYGYGDSVYYYYHSDYAEPEASARARS